MSSWSSGYVADIAYTHGFYRELTPALLSFVGLARGLRAPDVAAPLTYCELGCGQGFSANLLAAANPQLEIFATDFNPSHIAGAQALANTAGTPNVCFYDRSFAEFGSERSLPESFDIIALHGIYSWISTENREHVREFVRERLKLGGLLYISYNTLPGWAQMMPLRRLLVDHAGTASGPIAPRIDAALGFADALRASGANYFGQNPIVPPRFEKMKSLSRNYLAHEYFNRDWTPFYFGDIAAEMAELKLSFVGSANILDQIEAINLSEDQQKLLAEAADPVRREGLRDFIVNQQFRRDVYVKGALPLSPTEASEAWLATRFALSTPRADVSLKVKGARGEATLQAQVYDPLLDAFASGPASLQQLLSDETIADLGWAKLTQAIGVLVGAGHLQPCLPAEDEAMRRERTGAFNAAVCHRAQQSGDLAFLASPVTGGGIPVDRFAQLFLLGKARGESDPAAFAWQTLSSQGQRVVKDGKPLDSAEENLAELRTRLAEFEAKRIPTFEKLGVL